MIPLSNKASKSQLSRNLFGQDIDQIKHEKILGLLLVVKRFLFLVVVDEWIRKIKKEKKANTNLRKLILILISWSKIKESIEKKRGK